MIWENFADGTRRPFNDDAYREAHDDWAGTPRYDNGPYDQFVDDGAVYCEAQETEPERLSDWKFCASYEAELASPDYTDRFIDLMRKGN